MRIALAGNPNSGKTSLFNTLTGMRQHVGNWPGKTVERKEGHVIYQGKRVEIIDLPGTYSLSAYSIEEIVARDFIVKEHPDLVVNIVDASNIERNLYLTIQLIELGANVVLALNMNRFAHKKGMRIDAKKLSQLLGIPVIKIEAINQASKKELLESIMQADHGGMTDRIRYGTEIDEHLDQLTGLVSTELEEKNPRWTALRILEDDKIVLDSISGMKNGDKVLAKSKRLRKHLDDVFGEDVDTAIADARYGFITGLLKESLSRSSISRRSFSEHIDRVFLNRLFGIPFFFLAMYLMFQITFTVSAPAVGWIDGAISFLADASMRYLDGIGAPVWLSSLIGDGLFGGLGSVLVFVPIIMILFLIISLLEDSGYMARVAFIMDKIMHTIGLHGKAFIPFLLGFGCTVPAIMATRTLESRKDRLLTMLLSPMISCGAKLPVYVLFTAAFFSKNEAEIIFSLYMLGIFLALSIGLLFKNTIFRGKSSPFVMELPPYRLPTLKGSLIHMWERGRLFMIKAGSVIFASVLVIWFLSSVPFGVEYGSEHSVVGMLGKTISPIFAPLGFGNWQASVSLFFGFVAKEVVVGSMGALYGVGEEGLVSVLQGSFSSLSAYSFMVFVLLYVPCLTVLATIRRETNSWRWPAFTAIYLTVVAWIVSFIVYQGGLLLGLG
ncbi:MAG: ferrous iron transport protein B [archaeon]